MYIKKPMEIENKSMDIIERAFAVSHFCEEEKTIVKRMIHTTGDTAYQDIAVFKNGFIFAAKEALRQGIKIFTDTRMVQTGINKAALAKSGCELLCFIDDERVFSISKEKEITRSSAAVDFALESGARAFVIGNAPTALFRLLELCGEGKIKPAFVVGVPVGFVGAAESKEALRNTALPQLSTEGTKGGSNVAASVINALLYMFFGR